MRCARCGAIFPPSDQFCGQCGAPRPVLDPRFAEAEHRLTALRASYQAGEIDKQTYDAQARRPMVDGAGAYWLFDPDGGVWYRYEGDRWIQRDPPLDESRARPGPPAVGAPSGGAPIWSSTAAAAPPVRARRRGWMWVLIAVPILALIACVCVSAIYLAQSADRHRIGELFAPLQDLIDRVEPSARTAEWKTENPVSARIGSDGGEIVGPDGVTLIVPEGALPGETEIRVAQVTELSVQPPDALSFGTAYEIVAPPDTQFMFPVEVYLPFVRQPDLGDEYCSVYRWDGQTWYDLGGVIEGDRIRVYLNKFSIVGTWYTSLSRARLLFVNLSGTPTLVYPWAWNTEDRLYKGGYAFTSKGELFGPRVTWGDERFPFGTYYSWCVEWQEWTEPVWDLHGGGYWSEYVDTFHMFLNVPVTLSKDSPGGDYVNLTRVTFAVTNGIKGVCGDPPGLVQIPPTPTAIAAATSTPVPTATPPATATPVPAATLTLTPPATASATPATPTSTPTATPSATSATRNIQVIEEIVKGTQNEPDLVIWANPEHQSPPDGVQIEYAPNTGPYSAWRLLHQEGDWIEATFTLDVAAIGVQFTGDKWCGIGRVLVDGEEVWSGDTYGPWPDGPGYNVYIRISGVGPGSHTLRVENPGIKGPNSLEPYLHVYFFGLDYP